MKIETRTISASLRAADIDEDDDDALELRGTAAAYNTLSGDLGGFREQIAPGAFARSLADGDDVVCLFNHDANQVLGRTRSGTLKLQDSKGGLNFRCKLDPNQQAHRDLHASIKRGDISECSFAFGVNPNGDQFENVADERGKTFLRRTLRDLKLFDVSAVTFPAYKDGATNVSARSFDYVISKRGGLFAAELAAIDKQTDELLRLRLERVGDEIAQEKLSGRS
jgi:HK97 family phage prohead protease